MEQFSSDSYYGKESLMLNPSNTYKKATINEFKTKATTKPSYECDDKTAAAVVKLENGRESNGEDFKISVAEGVKGDADNISLGEELEKVLSRLILKDDPLDKVIDRPTQLLKAYLFKNGKEFMHVLELRDRGWNANKEQGDAHFEKQREKADNADQVGEERFFKMMTEFAFEMNLRTKALSPLVAAERAIKVLDICMAPGGYSAYILKLHSTAKIFGITLRKEEGGHPLMVSFHQMHGCKFMEVTMLVSEFTQGTNRAIPKDHPDYENFNTTRPYVSHKMDIVICDGMILRTHDRASYRQDNEAIRLTTAQLILGMQRIIQGGTLIMLLHKIDSWATAIIIYTFSKFTQVQVLKPQKKHNTRSSFYMIAKEVDVESLAAAAAVAEWKKQ